MASSPIPGGSRWSVKVVVAWVCGLPAGFRWRDVVLGSWMSWTILAVTIAISTTDMLLKPAAFTGVDPITSVLGWSSERVARGEWWRIVTSTLTNSRVADDNFLTSPLGHLISNMVGLGLAGPRLERAIGHLRFLLLYVLAAIAANAVAMATVSWYWDGTGGSSRSVYALLGGILVVAFLTRRASARDRWYFLVAALSILVLAGVIPTLAAIRYNAPENHATHWPAFVLGIALTTLWVRTARRLTAAVSCGVLVASVALIGSQSTIGGRAPSRALSAPEIQARVEANVSDTVQKWHPPGISVALRLRDGRMLTVVRGVERVDTRTPVTTTSVFAAGSASKTFVAAAVLRLVEERRLRLDDPIHEWVPEVPSSIKITIRHLLAHTSGLEWDPGSWEQWYRDIAGKPGVAMPDRREPRLVAEPGASYRYENGNYELLAKIAEKVSNENWARVLRSRFLDPLNLRRTFVQPDERPRPPITHGYDRPSVHDYDWPGARSLDVDVSEGGKGYVPSLSITSVLHAGGGMASTPTDLARWARGLWGGDVLERSSRSAMLSVSDQSTKPRDVPGFDGYGFGVVRTRLGGHVLWSHGGGTTGFRAFVGYIPHLDLSFAVTVNTSRDDFIVGELVQAILRSLGVDAPTPIIA